MTITTTTRRWTGLILMTALLTACNSYIPAQQPSASPAAENAPDAAARVALADPTRATDQAVPATIVAATPVAFGDPTQATAQTVPATIVVPAASPTVEPTRVPPMPTAAPTRVPPMPTTMPTALPTAAPTTVPTLTPPPPGAHPLSVEHMRQQEYPGSDIVIEQVLSAGGNYDRYLASYTSEGLRIYALLTVPQGQRPERGWPVVVFNHGYIPPAQYRTTERYVAYVDGFARNGYIVFRPDYRGHGSSDGEATGGYGSPAYTIDVLNAVSSIKRYKDADPNRIGMWGHSMGGHITLRSMVTTQDVKAGVIWAGVVASYPDLLSRWRRPSSGGSATPPAARRWRDDLIAQYGTPETNPEFWNAISPNAYLDGLSGPIQLHHGTADASVPVEFSERLSHQVEQAGKTIEYYQYQGDDHNISQSFGQAMQRSIAFFDRYVKGS